MADVYAYYFGTEEELLDIEYFCSLGCAEAEGRERAEVVTLLTPPALDYPVYCDCCETLLPVPLTVEGVVYVRENMDEWGRKKRAELLSTYPMLNTD